MAPSMSRPTIIWMYVILLYNISLVVLLISYARKVQISVSLRIRLDLSTPFKNNEKNNNKTTTTQNNFGQFSMQKGHWVKHGMEWSGMEWNGMEWNGLEWNGMEWFGMEWNGMEWIGILSGTFPFHLKPPLLNSTAP